MTLRLLKQESYVPDLSIGEGAKETFGEVHTPMALVNQVLDLLPEEEYRDPNKKWLDSGAGRGNFALGVYWRLMKHLVDIPEEQRHEYIVGKMLYIVEIQDTHLSHLRTLFGQEANIVGGDYLSYRPEIGFDFVVGNPPYNLDGVQKVPANGSVSKKEDGKAAWFDFVRHSMNLLVPEGSLLYVTPLIWMRPDRFDRYGFFMNHELVSIRCISDTNATKRAFGPCGQTPLSLFHMRKSHARPIVSIFDADANMEVHFRVDRGCALPVNGACLMQAMSSVVARVGHLHVHKTNMPPKGCRLNSKQDASFPFPNIRSCLISDGRKKSWSGSYDARLEKEYSNVELAYAGQPKLVMAHRRLGMPFLDLAGTYGISNRDAYVYMGSRTNMMRAKRLLSTRLALYIFSCFRYRMKYLEKEAFWYIPNVANLPELDKCETEADVYNLLGLSLLHRDILRNATMKNYSFIVHE